MKKVYMLAMSLLIIGSVTAQKIGKISHSKKISNETKSFVKKGQKQSVTPFIGDKAVTAALNETFEVAVPPAGWGGGNWVISSSLSGPAPETYATGHTGHFATFDAYNLAIGDSGMLITPKLQPVTGSATVSYKVQYVRVSTNTGYKGTGAELYIDISTNGGTSWVVRGTTNILASIANYNLVTTAIITNTVDLTPYIGNNNVKVRFRAVSDYGWADIAIDNVTGPNVNQPVNDVAVTSSDVSFAGMSYYAITPVSELGPIDFKVFAVNAGSAAQTNVNFHVDINNGAFSGSTGTNNPIASLAATASDSLMVQITPTATGATNFGAKMWLSQTQTDENPGDNIADSVYFAADPSIYMRAGNLSTLLTSYSFGTSALAITGMEYGATYHFLAADQIDSVSVLIYSAAGTGTVVGKVYSIDLGTGAETLVGETAPYTPSGSPEMPSLALTTPYAVAAGSLLKITVALNITVGTDTIAIGADGSFPGDASIAGACYLNVGGTWGWYTVTGTVPLVGCVMHTSSTTTGHVVAGKITYPNTPNTALANVTINLLNGATVVATTTSNATGDFSFTNIADGSYTFSATTATAFGGLTATDALKLKRHIAGLELQTLPIKLTACDPNNSSSITATDALKVLRRIAGLDATFTRPDWIFELLAGGNAVTVAGADVTLSIYGICTGDVNGSYIPVY